MLSCVLCTDVVVYIVQEFTAASEEAEKERQGSLALLRQRTELAEEVRSIHYLSMVLFAYHFVFTGQ